MRFCRFTVFAVTLAVLFASCIPRPHTEPVSPHLVGILRDSSGAPTTGTPVRLALRGRTCAESESEIVTDSNGVFRFVGRERRARFVFALVDVAVPEYSVCLRRDSSWDTIFTGYMQPFQPAPHDTLSCDQPRARWRSLVCSKRYGLRLPDQEL